MFRAALCTMTKICKQPRGPSAVVTYTMECYSALKKNGILPLANAWVDLQGMMLSDMRQTDKDKRI